MAKLRVCVVGLGMGLGHVNGYRQHQDAEVVAISDINEELLKQRSSELGISKIYTSAEEMFEKEKPDIVSIAVPNKFHKPLTVCALERGAHVLCEKPMAMNAKEAEEMIAAAKKAGKRLMINFSFRFTEQSFAMKKEIDVGTIGDIYFARTVWHRRRGMPKFGGWFGQKALSGGGPLIDLGVHRLDLALWLMNYPEPEYILAGTYNPIASELAKRENKVFDVEDLAVAMIKFKNGATLELEASWAANIKERERMETRLLGTKGGMYQQNLEEGYKFSAEIYIERNGCQYDMKLHPPVPEAENSMCHFVNSILQDKPHIATAEEGLTVMRILDGIYLSAEKNEPVKIKLP